MQRLLLILIFVVIGIVNLNYTNTNKPVNYFKKNVGSFVKIYLNDYKLSEEKYARTCNDGVLNDKGNYIWNKTITLKSKRVFENKYKQKVYQRLYMGFYQFSDSVKCKDAFNTLMNCLGNDCAKVGWGDSSRRIKTTPFIYIKTNKEIVFCKIICEHQNKYWGKFKLALIKKFKKSSTKVIESGCATLLTFKEIN